MDDCEADFGVVFLAPYTKRLFTTREQTFRRCLKWALVPTKFVSGTKKNTTLVPVDNTNQDYHPGLKILFRAVAPTGTKGVFSPGSYYQPGLKGLPPGTKGLPRVNSKGGAHKTCHIWCAAELVSNLRARRVVLSSNLTPQEKRSLEFRLFFVSR
jgi:hypothetical protein